jgi:hypothetical protein
MEDNLCAERWRDYLVFVNLAISTGNGDILEDLRQALRAKAARIKPS